MRWRAAAAAAERARLLASLAASACSAALPAACSERQSCVGGGPTPSAPPPPRAQLRRWRRGVGWLAGRAASSAARRVRLRVAQALEAGAEVGATGAERQVPVKVLRSAAARRAAQGRPPAGCGRRAARASARLRRAQVVQRRVGGNQLARAAEYTAVGGDAPQQLAVREAHEVLRTQGLHPACLQTRLPPTEAGSACAQWRTRSRDVSLRAAEKKNARGRRAQQSKRNARRAPSRKESDPPRALHVRCAAVRTWAGAASLATAVQAAASLRSSSGEAVVDSSWRPAARMRRRAPGAQCAPATSVSQRAHA